MVHSYSANKELVLTEYVRPVIFSFIGFPGAERWCSGSHREREPWERESDTLEAYPPNSLLFQHHRPLCPAHLQSQLHNYLCPHGLSSWDPPSIPPCLWHCGGTNSLQSPCAIYWSIIWCHALGFRDSWCRKWPCIDIVFGLEDILILCIVRYFWRPLDQILLWVRDVEKVVFPDSWVYSLLLDRSNQAPFVLTSRPWLQGPPELRFTLNYHNLITFSTFLLSACFNGFWSFYLALTFFSHRICKL